MNERDIVDRLRAERDAARAEVERLRAVKDEMRGALSSHRRLTESLRRSWGNRIAEVEAERDAAYAALREAVAALDDMLNVHHWSLTKRSENGLYMQRWEGWRKAMLNARRALLPAEDGRAVLQCHYCQMPLAARRHRAECCAAAIETGGFDLDPAEDGDPR